MSNDALDPAMKRWEDTRNLLSAALKEYLDSCTSLYAILDLRCGDIGAEEITTRIESTLSSLQYEMTQQLTQISSTLPRARNRLSSPILYLPKDMLFEIFSHIIYAPEHRNLSMKECLRKSYSSLRNLMAVCSDWRHFAVNHGVFWKTIPACG
ncbi:hypothetical protein ACGC1H_005697 [Rhizoctonia solani]